ncbi:MAG TPA: NUDIX domain-containing protein [bacterium]|nr:NUDIX domain-containing protein [bacterium]
MTNSDFEISSSDSAYEIKWEGDFAPASLREKTAVEEFWATAAAASSGKLRNDPLLTMSHFASDGTTTRIKAKRTQYMHYYAAWRNPALGIVLESVAVSGVILMGDASLLVARRGEKVSHYPGCFEFTPSGGIDGLAMKADGSVDFKGQLIREFEEETGIGKDAIVAIEPFSMIHDKPGRVYDICSLMRISEGSSSIIPRLQTGEEYSEFAAVPIVNIRDFIAENEFIPTAESMVEILFRGRMIC